MADDHYKPGSMDVTEQEKTFAGFVHFATWMAGLALVFLVLLAMFNS